jgi:hypothetical protein
MRNLLNKIEQAKKLLDLQWEDIPPATRAGFEMAKHQAADSILTLTKELVKETIPGRLIGIFAKGPDAALDALQKLVETQGGIILNANQVYLDFTKEIEPSFGSDTTFKVASFIRLSGLYRTLNEDLGIEGFKSLDYVEMNCPTRLHIEKHVKKIVRNACGDALTIKFLTKHIVDTIVRDGLEGKFIPVVVTQADDTDFSSLSSLFHKTIQLNLTDAKEVTKENIFKALREVLK